MTFISTSRARLTGITATGMLAVALVLSGCSSDSSTNAQNQSPDTASASASAEQQEQPQASADSSPSAEGKAKDQQPAQSPDSSKKSEDDSSQPSDADPGKIESQGEKVKASQVPLDQENVKTTEDLYTGFENVLQNVETKTVDTPSAEEAEQLQENTATGENIALADKTAEDIKKVATGSAADDFTASALEFASSGWSQEGSAKFVGEPKLADTEFQGKPAKLLEVCVDASDVKIKDSAGNVLTSDSTSKRSLNIFTLTEDNGSWKIAYREMPNNPDC